MNPINAWLAIVACLMSFYFGIAVDNRETWWQAVLLLLFPIVFMLFINYDNETD